jgi:hypothetical protein
VFLQKRDLRLSDPEKPGFRPKVFHKTALARAPGTVNIQNVKMGKAKFRAFFDFLIGDPPPFSLFDQNARVFERCPLT